MPNSSVRRIRFSEPFQGRFSRAALLQNRGASGQLPRAPPIQPARENRTLPADLSTWLASHWQTFSLAPLQLLAYGAGALAVGFAAAGALVRTMVPLRWLAVGSSLGFLVFGALLPSPTTLAVAAVLLPINLYRLREILRLTRPT
jgi:energy-converting hydrogenase Eha subunit E